MLALLIDHQKMCHMQKLANTLVNIKLTLLDELHLQMIKDSKEMSAFVNQDPSLVKASTLLAVWKMPQHVLQALDKFDSMLEPIPLKHQVLRNPGSSLLPRITASVAVKMPVILVRCKSHVTSCSVELHCLIWNHPHPEGPEEEQVFELCFKILPPATGDQDQTGKVTCSSYSIQIINLTPDTNYQSSIKRVNVSNLVYGMWINTMTLHTKAVSANSTD
ncbi:fibronectin type III domain-containing protein 11-like [Myripristis murdjan]|uniref:fibronectin type III domain-containing protein 11-like n=1 Tax=Myripristis murdjan TaxID=586833 RepID=UPI001175CCF9|nr:fibronectin type III domain-containing protein 11 [Myripristis murdjan]